MHQKTDKKIKLIFYIFLIIILTSINNYNFKIQNIFNIKYIYIDGLSKEKNENLINFFISLEEDDDVQNVYSNVEFTH